MLALLINQTLIQLLRLRVQLHYVTLNQVHRLLHRLLLLRSQLYILLRVHQRLLQTLVLRRDLLLLTSQLIVYYLQRTLYLTDHSRLRSQLLCRLLLLTNLVPYPRQLV